jgi:hypothetical protein
MNSETENQFRKFVATKKPRAILLLALVRRLSLWLTVDENVLLAEVVLGQNCTHALMNTSYRG